MINCAYCGAGNKDDATFCTQCGAPRKHAFEVAPLSRATTTTALPVVLTVSAVTWEVQGYDASAWNGNQNAAITRLLTQFGHLRGGYGNGVYDPKYPVYRDLCDLFNIMRGMYWYCWIGGDWRAHASAISNLWKASPGQLEITIDCENTTLDMPATASWIYSLVQEVQLKTGEVPMIYTSPYWWNTHVGNTTWAGYLPLWVAMWNEIAAAPTVPYDWSSNEGLKRWRYWQWLADGNCKAAEYGFTDGDADLDLNRFNGPVTAFNSLYGTNILPLGEVTDPEPLPVTPGEVAYLYRTRVTAGSLNVRAGPPDRPYYEQADLGELMLNSVVPIEAEYGDWLKITGWIHKNYTKKL